LQIANCLKQKNEKNSKGRKLYFAIQQGELVYKAKKEKLV
jgi:hypothetical protein